MNDTESDQTPEITDALPAEINELPEFKTTEPPKLKGKAALFCKWYALVGNGVIAYERAGLVSKKPARQAHKLLGREIVRAYVQALRTEIVTGQAMGRVSPEWVTERYRDIAAVRVADLMVHDPVAGPRWKELGELTEVERGAICEIILSQSKVKDDEGNVTLGPARITGYRLYPKPDALAALARFAGMNKDTVKHDHAHTVRGKVKGVFQFVAQSPATSETVARLRAKHGNAGARVIEHDTGAEVADPRELRKLRGV